MNYIEIELSEDEKEKSPFMGRSLMKIVEKIIPYANPDIEESNQDTHHYKRMNQSSTNNYY